MRDEQLNDLIGKDFTLAIPKKEDAKAPPYCAQCQITDANQAEITVKVIIYDWLDEVFTLPTPVHLFTLWRCVHISVCEIVEGKKVEFLCTS